MIRTRQPMTINELQAPGLGHTHTKCSGSVMFVRTESRPSPAFYLIRVRGVSAILLKTENMSFKRDWHVRATQSILHTIALFKRKSTNTLSFKHISLSIISVSLFFSSSLSDVPTTSSEIGSCVVRFHILDNRSCLSCIAGQNYIEYKEGLGNQKKRFTILPPWIHRPTYALTTTVTSTSVDRNRTTYID